MTIQNFSLKHATEVYLTRCQVEGKSPNTVVAYRETLGQFLDVARGQEFAHDVREIATEHIYSFLAWVERLDCLQENLFRHIRNLKLPQKVITPSPKTRYSASSPPSSLPNTWPPETGQ